MEATRPPQKYRVASFRVDEQLWREAKAYAAYHGITTKQLIESLLRKELENSRVLDELKKKSKPKEEESSTAT